jgi:pyruvate kinase
MSSPLMPPPLRRTKIVVTLGPACDSPAGLDALMAAGADVVRLNLSHGVLEEHLDRLARVRAAAARARRHIAVLADLPGPKVRSGVFPEGGSFLVEGATLKLVVGTDECSAEHISVDYPTLLDDLRPGDTVILGDGAITLTVEDITADAAVARVVTGGRAQGRPGVHIPAERLRLHAPTAQDIELLKAMTTAGVDFAAVSFVRSAEDVALAKAAAGPDGPKLVAKIETAPAIADLERILQVADAVMVARGDLGIECPLEDVPHLQKKIIRSCVEAGVPVITATQMLESMITAPAPTRAEVSDVANAVFDGTDAVMLSAETAIGADPVLVVVTMARIAARAEAEASYRQWGDRLGRVQRKGTVSDAERVTQAITHAAFQAAADVGVKAILCCTRSGTTAKAMARFRPDARLLGLSPDPSTARVLALSWGVTPILVDTYRSTDEMVWCAVEASVREGFVGAGDLVAVLAGAPDRGQGGATDVLRVVSIH